MEVEPQQITENKTSPHFKSISDLSNTELVNYLLIRVWTILHVHSEAADLLDEAMYRLRGLPENKDVETHKQAYLNHEITIDQLVEHCRHVGYREGVSAQLMGD